VDEATLKKVFATKPEPDAYQLITEALTPLVDTLAQRLTPGHEAAAIAETLAVKWGPEAQWRRADDAERDQDRRAARATYAEQAGEDVFRLDHLAHRHTQEVSAVIERALDPPDALTAWTKQTGTGSLAANESLSLTILDELRQARFDRELGTAQPSAVLQQYEAALRDPFEQSSASLIRYVEGRHRTGWTGVLVTEHEARALTSGALLKAIAATRAIRMPAAAAAVRALITKAEALVNQATSHGRIRSQRPSGWRAA